MVRSNTVYSCIAHSAVVYSDMNMGVAAVGVTTVVEGKRTMAVEVILPQVLSQTTRDPIRSAQVAPHYHDM